MSIGLILLIVLALAVAGYAMGRARSVRAAGGDARKLHSLPGSYGQMAFLFTAVPALLVLMAWLLIQPIVVENRAANLLTPADIPDGSNTSLVMADVRRIADGLDLVMAEAGMGEGDHPNT